MHRSPLHRVVAVSALVLACLSTPIWAAEPITPQGLLAEMTDLRLLAEFPEPAYTMKQFSSYDRASTTPDNKKTWFANGDAGHFIREEQVNGRTERVMMDAKGPGAVFRIWSANPAGTLRVYIDGNEKPAIEAKMEDILSGKVESLPMPIAGIYSKGYNLYLPITYAKSCKITSDDKGFYYLINYRTYPEQTQVTSFTADDLNKLKGAIAKVAKALAEPAKAAKAPEKTQPFEATIAPGATKTVGTISGPMAISSLRVKLPENVSDEALRAAVLRISFDGQVAVEVPLGDFFGTAPGVNPYASLPLGVTKNRELYSHWFMPFRESATVEVKNLGKSEITFTGEVGTSAYQWNDRSMYFNAGYRSQYDVESQPPIDWNYLETKGKGAFVGASFTIDNPVKDWWGEGDEKIYVDGEKMPSWFGTGTEDYFGYAWCWPGLFEHAYHNQPRCDGPGNYGRTSVNRWHIVDRIPYLNSFKFDMELWHWKKCKVNMAVTTYWYSAPGGTDSYKALAADDVKLMPMPEYQRYKVAGVLEGEEMKILASSATADPQDWPGTSNEYHLWWHNGARPGDVLTLGFDAPSAGKHEVVGRFLKAVDYGIVKIAINGKEVEKPIDFYNDGVLVSDEISLGVFDLQQGQNKITVTMVGKNPKAKPEYLFGLDYLKLNPATGANAAR